MNSTSYVNVMCMLMSQFKNTIGNPMDGLMQSDEYSQSVRNVENVG